MTALTKEMIDDLSCEIALHVHLPGVITPDTALQLGIRNKLIKIENGKIIPLCKLANIPENVTYKDYSDIFHWDNDEHGNIINLRYDINDHNFTDFDQVMGIVQGHKYAYGEGGILRAVGGIQTAEDFRFVLQKHLERCIEGRFAYFELKQNLFLAQTIYPYLPVEMAEDAFFDLLKEAQEKFYDAGIGLRWQNCFNKSSNVKTAEAAEAKCTDAAKSAIRANKRYPGLITGIDGAGNEIAEAANPLYQVRGYLMAGDAGINRLCHAGEAGHWQMVARTIKYLNPKRIGHGFQAMENFGTMMLMLERGIPFEVCVSMNNKLGFSARMSDKVAIKMIEETMGKPLKLVDGNKLVGNSIWDHLLFPMLRMKIDGRRFKITLSTDNPGLGGVPFKEMLMQLAGLRPEVTGHPPNDMKPLQAEEFYRCRVDAIEQIPDLAIRIKCYDDIDRWARKWNLDVGLPKDVRLDRDGKFAQQVLTSGGIDRFNAKNFASAYTENNSYRVDTSSGLAVPRWDRG